MSTLVFALQIISGLLTVFFILIKEPRSEGLGAIGSAAHSFKGVKTSADEQLDQSTWLFVGIFIVSSFILGLKLV
jgi:protein translocase SecG subunit